MAESIRPLAGKVAVITGGSRGLGLGFATVLGRAGATVVLGARSAGGIEAAVAALVAEGIDASGQPTDVANLDEVEALGAAALDRGGLHIWVNNAGQSGVFGPTHLVPPADFAGVVATNILGTYHGSRVAVRHMRARREGHLVNIYGRGATGPVPLQNSYASSKAWIRMFTRALQAEAKGTGVQIHGMNPGLVLTDMLGDVKVVPGYDGKVRGLVNVASMWGQSPEVAARPILDLVSGAASEYRDLTPPRMVARSLRWLRAGRPHRLDLSVETVDD